MMNEGIKTGMSRRGLAMGAAAGGASLFLGAATSFAADGPRSASRNFIVARQFGAKGDGKSDDTAALQRALDAIGRTSGGLFLPPGVYVCGELHVRASTAIVGIPAWNYSSPGGSVLKLANASAKCLLNLTEARGATVEGISLEGGNFGSGVHGIATFREKWGPHEDSFRIDGCQILRFTGDGIHLECAWAFTVRHSMMGYNHGDGLSLRGWDGFLLDNWFSGNKRAGYAARHENASVTFTANRIEWNGEENMVITGADGYQITGNFFDRAGTYGIALRKGRGPCTQVAITGNFIKRSGKLAGEANIDSPSASSAQILLEGAEGVTCVGNVLQAGRDDGGSGVWSPAFGIVYESLENCVIKENVLHDGAIKQLILDKGQHRSGVVVGDNPGRLFTEFSRKW